MSTVEPSRMRTNRTACDPPRRRDASSVLSPVTVTAETAMNSASMKGTGWPFAPPVASTP